MLKWVLGLAAFVLLAFKLVWGTLNLVQLLNAPMLLTVLVVILLLMVDVLVLVMLVRLSVRVLTS